MFFRGRLPEQSIWKRFRTGTDGFTFLQESDYYQAHVVAINRSDERRIVPLDWEDAPAVALATGPDVAVDGLSVVLPPMMGAVLTV